MNTWSSLVFVVLEIIDLLPFFFLVFRKCPWCVSFSCTLLLRGHMSYAPYHGRNSFTWNIGDFFALQWMILTVKTLAPYHTMGPVTGKVRLLDMNWAVSGSSKGLWMIVLKSNVALIANKDTMLLVGSCPCSLVTVYQGLITLHVTVCMLSNHWSSHRFFSIEF